MHLTFQLLVLPNDSQAIIAFPRKTDFSCANRPGKHALHPRLKNGGIATSQSKAGLLFVQGTRSPTRSGEQLVYLAAFFLTTFFLATFFLLAFFAGTFFREAVAFFCFLLAAFFAAMWNSCRIEKRPGLYIDGGCMEAYFFRLYWPNRSRAESPVDRGLRASFYCSNYITLAPFDGPLASTCTCD